MKYNFYKPEQPIEPILIFFVSPPFSNEQKIDRISNLFLKNYPTNGIGLFSSSQSIENLTSTPKDSTKIQKLLNEAYLNLQSEFLLIFEFKKIKTSSNIVYFEDSGEMHTNYKKLLREYILSNKHRGFEIQQTNSLSNLNLKKECFVFRFGISEVFDNLPESEMVSVLSNDLQELIFITLGYIKAEKETG